jgi:hypothetical protein
MHIISLVEECSLYILTSVPIRHLMRQKKLNTDKLSYNLFKGTLSEPRKMDMLSYHISKRKRSPILP